MDYESLREKFKTLLEKAGTNNAEASINEIMELAREHLFNAGMKEASAKAIAEVFGALIRKV